LEPPGLPGIPVFFFPWNDGDGYYLISPQIFPEPFHTGELVELLNEQLNPIISLARYRTIQAFRRQGTKQKGKREKDRNCLLTSVLRFLV
jgi:hypothetical protein